MRALAWFWVAVVVLVAGGVGTLAWLGPPQPAATSHVATASSPPPAAGGPRVAILVAGLGMIASDSQAAIASLPPAVSLAVSPYAPDPEGTARAARAAGHEVLLSLPMQPADSATADAGREALAPGQSADVIATRLAWALGRLTHPAGTTSLLATGLDGGAFVASPALQAVTDTLAARHLWFLGGNRMVMLDAPGTTPQAALTALLTQARAHGSAIGAIGTPSPDIVEAMAKLLPGLAGEGITLVPVGVLMAPKLR